MCTDSFEQKCTIGQMKATPEIYVPVIYSYNSHLIGWHRHLSMVNARLQPTTRAWMTAVHAWDYFFHHNCLRKDLDVG